MKGVVCFLPMALSAVVSLNAAVVRTNDVCYLEGEDLASADAYRMEMCTVDVEFAQGAVGLPVLVWLHGGGLTRGGKGLLPLKCKDKIVQVGVGYRLMGRNGITSGDGPLSDAAAAIAWTFRHAVKYGGDPAKVFVSGSSAGGYLTMMVGMDPKWLGRHGFKKSDRRIPGRLQHILRSRNFGEIDDWGLCRL